MEAPYLSLRCVRFVKSFTTTWYFRAGERAMLCASTTSPSAMGASRPMTKEERLLWHGRALTRRTVSPSRVLVRRCPSRPPWSILRPSNHRSWPTRRRTFLIWLFSHQIALPTLRLRHPKPKSSKMPSIVSRSRRYRARRRLSTSAGPCIHVALLLLPSVACSIQASGRRRRSKYYSRRVHYVVGHVGHCCNLTSGSILMTSGFSFLHIELEYNTNRSQR
mmetsp:Transcript_51099/g.76329  ORF Transcript_51099/g.76329 Transcript_51099/m.76329 type:complete len:220 (-) Transcript_51099:19-678(-)